MGDHQQGAAAAAQIPFQELHRLDVEVIGGLVHYVEFGVGGEHAAQGHALDLSPAEFLHGAREIPEPEGGQQFLRPLGAARDFKHGGLGVVFEFLLQEGDAYIFEKQYLAARIGLVATGEDAKERGLAGAVGGDQRDLVAFVDIEADALEEDLGAVGFRNVLDLQKTGHKTNIRIICRRSQGSRPICAPRGRRQCAGRGSTRQGSRRW